MSHHPIVEFRCGSRGSSTKDPMGGNLTEGVCWSAASALVFGEKLRVVFGETFQVPLKLLPDLAFCGAGWNREPPAHGLWTPP